MRSRGTFGRGAFAAAVIVASALALSGCGADGSQSALPGVSSSADGPSQAPGSQTAPPSAAATPVSLRTNIASGSSDVPVDTVVGVSASSGTIKSVSVSSPAGKVAGSVIAGGTRWRATQLLEPGTTYTVAATATNADGKTRTKTSRFTTQPLTLAQQTYASISPLQGQKVGVGMPVIVKFDVPVTNRAAMERHMHVTAQPAQPGTWHWISDYEVHYRPKTYWKADSTIDVNLDVNSVPAGNGVYGQEDRHVQFTTGAAHIYKVNTVTDEMKVYSNGDLLRTIPITTGRQPDFTTRSGVKVIVEKDASKTMNSETIGIGKNSPDYYDLSDVQWAMRLTFSGEFIHAAPWSVADQGVANVSHGCTGMSTENADWLFHMSRVGDVVEYTGTDKPMTLTNGYGDWNESYKQYAAGSAL
jgi:lipoprotein-anchoring transpeptidase ErfK/SrfK